jgi:hypothetical protein
MRPDLSPIALIRPPKIALLVSRTIATAIIGAALVAATVYVAFLVAYWLEGVL